MIGRKPAWNIPLTEGRLFHRCSAMPTDRADCQKMTGSNSKAWMRWLGIWVFVTFLAIYFCTQTYWAERYSRNVSASWLAAFYWNLVEFYLWALFSPLVFWLCRKFHHESRGWSRTVMLHLIAGILLSLIHCLFDTVGHCVWQVAHHNSFSFWPAYYGTVVYRLQINVFLYSVLVGFWHAFDYHRKFQERRLKTVELEASLAHAQLLALKMQIQPHFLFNTLQAIAELVHVDIDAAEAVTLQLSELLRRTLKSGAAQVISLEEEIEFLKIYLAIEQVRLKERLNVDLKIDPATFIAAIPPLLLQPLVENAVRHGIAPIPGKGTVSVSSHLENDTLILEIHDTGPGINGGAPYDLNEGIGLKNTRARLQTLYGANHYFELTNQNGLTIRMSLPYTTVKVPDETIHVS
jgi:two-component system, LytTR family, sensor kinase